MATEFCKKPRDKRPCPTPGCRRQCAWATGGHWFTHCGHCLETRRLEALRALRWSEKRIAETLPGFLVCDEKDWGKEAPPWQRDTEPTGNTPAMAT